MISSKKICSKLNLNHFGNEISLDKVSSIENPKNNSLIFIKKLPLKNEVAKKLSKTKNIFAILSSDFSEEEISNLSADKNLNSYVLHESPKDIFFEIIDCFFNNEKNRSEYISSLSHIDKNAKIGKNVFIDSNVRIEGDCVIGDNVYISKNCLIIGPCEIGNNTFLGSNVIIGEKSISVRYKDSKVYANAQLGGVVIGNFCRIGFNSAIAKGTIDNTIIGNHVMMGEFNSVAHNSVVGDNTVLTVRITINGSSVIGENCWMGPHSTVMSYVNVGDNIRLSPNSVLYSNVKRQGTYIGNPAKFFNI